MVRRLERAIVRYTIDNAMRATEEELKFFGSHTLKFLRFHYGINHRIFIKEISFGWSLNHKLKGEFIFSDNSLCISLHRKVLYINCYDDSHNHKELINNFLKTQHVNILDYVNAVDNL